MKFALTGTRAVSIAVVLALGLAVLQDQALGEASTLDEAVTRMWAAYSIVLAVAVAVTFPSFRFPRLVAGMSAAVSTYVVYVVVSDWSELAYDNGSDDVVSRYLAIGMAWWAASLAPLLLVDIMSRLVRGPVATVRLARSASNVWVFALAAAVLGLSIGFVAVELMPRGRNESPAGLLLAFVVLLPLAVGSVLSQGRDTARSRLTYTATSAAAAALYLRNVEQSFIADATSGLGYLDSPNVAGYDLGVYYYFSLVMLSLAIHLAYRRVRSSAA
jgi:hypothetical protein